MSCGESGPGEGPGPYRDRRTAGRAEWGAAGLFAQKRPGKKIFSSRSAESSESEAWIRFSRTMTP
ncbi:hypothetical protein GCM10018782_54060 [Streptomyces griseoaurantiacus]|nr:hypothetical protein GCM10018782_54060 [Streptomyces griseoaurantiacus]